MKNTSKKKLYRAEQTKSESLCLNFFDMEAKNKKEVRKQIKKFGYDSNFWMITRLH